MTPDSPRILLVEDDPDQAQLITLILAQHGYRIDTVPDAESALSHLNAHAVDLLLADWDLPEMKGDTLIRITKAHDATVKTILISNHLHVDAAASACGADAWSPKMDTISRLGSLLDTVLHADTAKA